MESKEENMSAEERFTKEGAEQTKKAVDEMFEAIPKSKRMGYLGHFNDIMLFIEAAARIAPSKEPAKKD